MFLTVPRLSIVCQPVIVPVCFAGLAARQCSHESCFGQHGQGSRKGGVSLVSASEVQTFSGAICCRSEASC